MTTWNTIIVNSYRGCIKIGSTASKDETIKLKYEGKEIRDQININVLSSSKFEFELKTEKTIKVDYNNQSFGYNFYMYYANDKTTLNNINSKYFSVYLNGYKLQKNEYTFLINNGMFSIKSELFLSTLIPHKNIYVKYNRNILDTQFDIGNVQLEIKQKEYEYSLIDFKYFAQVPVHFKAGDVPYFYLT